MSSRASWSATARPRACPDPTHRSCTAPSASRHATMHPLAPNASCASERLRRTSSPSSMRPVAGADSVSDMLSTTVHVRCHARRILSAPALPALPDSDKSTLRICPLRTYRRWPGPLMMGPLDRIVWITGASSGIGAALVATAPADARVIGIARRPSACAESIQADLSDPAEWPRVNAAIRETLAREGPPEAVLMHFAGVSAPMGAAATVDPTAYARAAMLNGVSGQVLGAAFLRSGGEVGCRASIVMCSSPAATHPRSGLSQYCAGKAALEQWVRAVAVEEATRTDGAYVFAVVLYAVDTPMVRELIEADDAVVPLAAHFRHAAREDRLADPNLTADEIGGYSPAVTATAKRSRSARSRRHLGPTI